VELVLSDEFRTDDPKQYAAGGGTAYVVVALEDVVMHQAGEGWRGDVAEDVDGDGLQAEGERLQVRRRLEQNDACDRGLHTVSGGGGAQVVRGGSASCVCSAS